MRFREIACSGRDDRALPDGDLSIQLDRLTNIFFAHKRNDRSTFSTRSSERGRTNERVAKTLGAGAVQPIKLRRMNGKA